MNRQKKIEYKKTLVRNTQKPVPKCTVVADSQIQSKADILGSTKVKVTPEDGTERIEESNKTIPKLSSPELHSTLKLSKKIDGIVKPRKTKSCSDVEKKKLAVDEKVSRRVNFPYDQPIYKDLIPLTCDRVQSQPIISTRGPLPQKDIEPVLSDFVEIKKLPPYYYLPSVKFENKLRIISNNNLRLYKTLQKHSDSQ